MRCNVSAMRIENHIQVSFMNIQLDESSNIYFLKLTANFQNCWIMTFRCQPHLLGHLISTLGLTSTSLILCPDFHFLCVTTRSDCHIVGSSFRIHSIMGPISVACLSFNLPNSFI